jgi:hypothetical protein
MNNRIKLTRDEIIRDNYLEEVDAGDSSESETDHLELNEETDEDDENIENSDDSEKDSDSELSVHLNNCSEDPNENSNECCYSRNLPHSKTVEMISEEDRPVKTAKPKVSNCSKTVEKDYEENSDFIYGRARKNQSPFKWDRNQNKDFFKQPELKPMLLEKANACSSIIDFFYEIFDETFIEKIVTCTNLRMKSPDDFINRTELLSFIGLMIIFGLTNKGNVEVSDIWSPNSIHYMV